jgi:ribosomal protein S18 acetylase RimI-like enzyme
VIGYKLGTKDIDWPQLFRLYGQLGLVAGKAEKKEFDSIRQAFINSYKVVTAWKDDKLGAAGRLISDGTCYGQIVDVGVLPEYQKQGIGKGIMTELMKDNQHLYLYLTSTFGNEEFYRKLGFKRHKTPFARYPVESEYLAD